MAVGPPPVWTWGGAPALLEDVARCRGGLKRIAALEGAGLPTMELALVLDLLALLTSLKRGFSRKLETPTGRGCRLPLTSAAGGMPGALLVAVALAR